MNTPFSAPTRRALRTLSLAYFVQATGALSVVGSLDAISRQWGLADSQSAYLLSVFGVTFAFAAPLLQVGFGHLRRRRQVLLGLALFSAAALLFAAAPNYPVLLLSRVLMGLGAGFIGPVLGALGSSLADREHQGSAIAVVLLGLSIAGLVGMPLSAWIAHAWGARVLFLAVGVTGAATTAPSFT
jgi:predicted MFS family arabinose efflux permease